MGRGLTPAEALPSAEPDAASPFADVPLSGRRIVGSAIEHLGASQAHLRRASFYAGAMAVLVFGPGALLLWAAIVRHGAAVLDGGTPQGMPDDFQAALGVATILAGFGYVALVIDSRAIAMGVIAGRLEGRPISVAGGVRLARRRFWRLIVVAVISGIVAILGQALGTAIGAEVFGPLEQISLVTGLVGGIIVASPFAYATAGVVLGEVRAFEAMRRSSLLFLARRRLALAVAAFGLASQFVLFFAVSAGLDLVVRVADLLAIEPGGLSDVLGGLAILVLVFAFGTLVFTAEALAAAPQVHAFAALTHYVRGLELARPAESAQWRGWQPWLGTGVVVAAVVGVVALVAGLAALGG